MADVSAGYWNLLTINKQETSDWWCSARVQAPLEHEEQTAIDLTHSG